MIRIETINESGRKIATTIKREQLNFQGEAIIYIGALGICVRKIQSFIKDKHTDPAVVCVDSTGRYVIPVLSGHIGGANELARELAHITGGEAIITTQSDNTGLWALDTIGKRYRWNTAHLEHTKMNRIIAAFVNQEPTALILEWEDEGTRNMEASCPKHVQIFRNLKEIENLNKFNLLIIISPILHDTKGKQVLQFFPPCLHLGVGCQKDAPVEIAPQLLDEVMVKGYATESIATIATIEQKANEPLITRLTELLPKAQKRIFSADELKAIKVPNPSDKVKEVMGCYGIAEAAAQATANAQLIVEKQKGFLIKNNQKTHYTFALAMTDCKHHMGHIEIVGAGPGDPELVSVRGKRFLEQADLILYAGSLVPKELTNYAKLGATVRSSAEMSLEEQFDLIKEFYDQGKLVVRLHTGDPCIYGAIQEQMAFFDTCRMDYHITPGISSFLAAAAELKSQFTIPDRCQTIILTRGEGRTSVPEREKLHKLAKHQSTMCIFLSASLAEKVQEELLAGGYPPETPVAACYKLTWKEQRIYRGQLQNLAQMMNEHNLTLTTMIVVGDAIDNRKGLSKLYDEHFTHLFRKGKE